MIPFLLTLAALSQAAAGGDAIAVHEWGVVLYGSDDAVAVGAPAVDPLGAICVDAPVLTFHGAPFTGDVAVCSLGEITAVYPDPDGAGGAISGILGGLGSCVRWEGLSVGPGMPSDADRWAGPPVAGFDWAVGLWRVPGVSRVSRSRDAFEDAFLYYEVEFGEDGLPVPLEGLAPAGTPPEELSGDVLVFRRRDGWVTADFESPAADRRAVDESLPTDVQTGGAGGALQTVRAWADGLLTEEELGAMWGTWEPYILYGDWQGDSLLVFPLPQPLIERISTIVVTPDVDLPVTISRFFLGMKSSG